MFYNCHIHTFTVDDVPRKFLPLGLVRLLASRNGGRFVSRILNRLNPFSDHDVFDRYVRFLDIGKMGSQEGIFLECRKFYSRDTRFVVHAMDLSCMRAGKVPRMYEDQLHELSKLADKYPEVIPFVHIDPRRRNYLELFHRCVEKWGFKGVKIYPTLGYFPYHPGLHPVYEYCQKHNLPVLAHCSPYNPVHYRGSRKDVLAMLRHSRITPDLEINTRKGLCANFADPRNWEYVLNEFSGLTLCLAHFGSEHYWKEYLDRPGNPNNWFQLIRKMITKYPGLYTDISFTVNKEKYFPLLKILMTDNTLKRKILFGSDFYMVQTRTTERHFGLDLRARLGEEDFKTIAFDNPKRFFRKTHAVPSRKQTRETAWH